jgi:hypothetical protein
MPAGQPPRRALVQVVDPQALTADALGAVRPGAIMLPGSTHQARAA